MKIFRSVFAALLMLGMGVVLSWADTAPASDGGAMKSTPYTNSVGLKFLPVPGTTTLFCIYKTRVKDFAHFVDATHREWRRPDFSQTENDPVVDVSWEDAMAFCGWLTQVEHKSSKLPAAWKYRLPTDQEWSLAVGLPVGNNVPAGPDSAEQTLYPWGTDWPPPRGAGNYSPSLGVDSFTHTSPVGSFAANAAGLFDMGGNAWEWCLDRFNDSADFRVLRGASWHLRDPGDLLLSTRVGNQSDIRLDTYGFRCVIECPESRDLPPPVPSPSPAHP